MSQGGRVLVVGQRAHTCSPGWERHWCDGTGEMAPPAGWYLHDLDLPAGTVWECSCGQVWIAEAWPAWKDVNILMGRITWRREKRRERRRRERASEPFVGLRGPHIIPDPNGGPGAIVDG